MERKKEKKRNTREIKRNRSIKNVKKEKERKINMGVR